MEWRRIALLIVLGLTVVALELLYLKELRRSNNLKLLAQKMGWRFYSQNKAKILPNINQFQLLARQVYPKIRNIIYGNLEDVRFYIFDYSFYCNKTTINQTIICFDFVTLNLPNFTLQPDSKVFRLLMDKFRSKSVEISGDRNFVESYRLTGEDAENICCLFSTEVQALYSNQSSTQNICSEVKDNYFLYYHQERRFEAEEILLFLQEAKQAWQLLIANG
ncbi:MAG: hypothetical protein WA865_13970 [Spirulinaceae cyanobacterium]